MKSVILSALILFCYQVFGQKSTEAVRLKKAITLDGNVTAEEWSEIPFVTDFTVNFPKFGEISKFQSKVRVAYDDNAIYVSAELYDPQPDSVLAILSERDDFGNADWFGFSIDPWGLGQNGFSFCTTAAGVELDALESKEDTDFTWNAVWKSRAVLTNYGWSVEFRIPFSQLRFSIKDIGKWRINFIRHVRRIREQSFWSPVDPEILGEITQSAYLKGVEGIKPPFRLSFSPYSTVYLENNYNPTTNSQDWRFRPRFGMDMKMGLSESFTLDATLIPDFGQTVSDNLLLNLGPFEIRYQENRPFFLEGTDLFGIDDVFYSRRIGAAPIYSNQVYDSLSTAGASFKSLPSQAQLLNATKISGRTKKGLGIGVFNAIEGKSFASYIDSNGVEQEALIHPLSNYNVSVFSQDFKNNSRISFINTHVYRSDRADYSNVSSLSGALFVLDQRYSLVGKFQNSINSYETREIGQNIEVGIDKTTGEHRGSIGFYQCDDLFDPNALGYLEVNNYRGFWSAYNWTGFKPKGRFLRRTISYEGIYNWIFNPNHFNNSEIKLRMIGTFRNFLSVGTFVNMNPFTEHDFFETRVQGVQVMKPAYYNVGGWYSSDYSKKFALDVNYGYTFVNRKNAFNTGLTVSPRLRFGNKSFLILRTSVEYLQNDYGWVNQQDTLFDDAIMMGNRDRNIVTNTINFNYIFTNRISSTLKFNHYWQQVKYSYFMEVQNEGRLALSEYTGLNSDNQQVHNTSFNAFTVDLLFRWVMYPGSELNFVWKYNIYASKGMTEETYFSTFRTLFDNPYLNSFSLKALFFIDAGSKLKRRAK